MLVEELPTVTWDDVRRMADRAAAAKGEWAGAPIPINGFKLNLEPRYPFKGVQGMCLEKPGKSIFDSGEPVPADLREINSWYCRARNVVVAIWEEGGRREWGVLPAFRQGERSRFILDTIGVAIQAWSIEAEREAMKTLSTLIRPHLFNAYEMTGTFIETSPRSRLTYLFRRCRPTLVLANSKRLGCMVCIAALCLHPIGHYEGTFAGCMVPTDDVIAHLLMMRADERKFWSKANHHDLWSARAGV